MSELIRTENLPEVPWKNGAGVTRLLRSGEGWRISIAQVSGSCMFSCFPGIDRLSVVIRGGPLRLQNGAETVDLAPGVAAAYSGDCAWECQMLGKPATVLNVMCERGSVAREIKLGRRLLLSATVAETIVVLTVDGGMAYSLSTGETCTATRESALVCPGPVAVDCSFMNDSPTRGGNLVGIHLRTAMVA